MKMRMALVVALLTLTAFAWPGTRPASSAPTHFDVKALAGVDPAFAGEVAGFLEAHRERIGKALGYEYPGRVGVTVYPDMESLLREHGWQGVIAGVVTGWDTFDLVAPGKGFDRRGQLTVAVHEYTHLVVNRINWEVPVWLNEGIAYHLNGQMDSISEGFADTVAEGPIPTLGSMRDYRGFFAVQGCLAYSCSLVRYIVERYGYGALAELVRRPGDIKGILGVDSTGFHRAWSEWVKVEYGKR